MPPKKVSSKAPTAPPSKSASITPIAAPLPSQSLPQPAPAGKTKTATAVPSFDAASSAINEILDTVYDIFEHHTLTSELINAHNSILNNMRLVSDLFDAITPSTVAPIAPKPSTRSLTKDYASCKVQTDPILPITDIPPNPPVKKSFAQAAKAPGLVVKTRLVFGTSHYKCCSTCLTLVQT
ncbi:hypothetical protein AX14_001388 [Amanita brunnescens Koide BX004]|nr:hypothetical protein AX14_001388 [Amanita brunnescens Koide BX004]